MVILPARFPPRLAELGFVGQVLGRVEVIIPPLCDVPGGEFLMGSDPAQDDQLYPAEAPQSWVSVPEFQIAQFPVTVAEYACYVRDGGKRPGGMHLFPGRSLFRRWLFIERPTWTQQQGRLDHPVVNVDWREASAYTAWLARVTGEPWRLPTEAEWEKAARWDPAARRARIYPWGDAFDQARCNTDKGPKGTTAPVGSYPNGASPCGAQDMVGNVWEWTSSLYKRYPYRADDGRERADMTAWRDYRVVRGVSWDSDPIDRRDTRVAYRFFTSPHVPSEDRGFRLVRAALGM